MRNFLFVLVMSISLFSCKKDKAICDDSRTLQERIQGSWELTETFNPWTNESTAPTTEQQQILAFGDSLTLLDYQNTITVSYEITNAWLYSNGASGQVTIDCNTLVIDNTPVDGPRKTYSRVLED
jgi:hypothetical protein